MGVFLGTVQRRVEVLGFHDGFDRIVFTHHTAIGGRIFQFEAEEDHVCTFGTIKEAFENVGREQGSVAVHDEQTSIAFQKGHSGHEGMARAFLLLLFDTEGFAAEPGSHGFRFRRHHGGFTADESEDAVDAGQGMQSGSHERQHGLAQQGLEDFRAGRRHTGAFTGGKDESVDIEHVRSL